MIRVISSPSRSTTGFATLIFDGIKLHYFRLGITCILLVDNSHAVDNYPNAGISNLVTYHRRYGLRMDTRTYRSS